MRARSEAVLQELIAKVQQHGCRARRIEFNGTTQRGNGPIASPGACQRKTAAGMRIGQFRLQCQRSLVDAQGFAGAAGAQQH
jgi:hypothetical protein